MPRTVDYPRNSKWSLRGWHFQFVQKDGVEVFSGNSIGSLGQLAKIHEVDTGVGWVHHAEGLLEGLFKRAANGHDFTYTLHGAAEDSAGEVELSVVPAGYLCDNVIQTRLEAGSGVLRDNDVSGCGPNISRQTGEPE